jgi:hypothetical protein
MIWRVLSHAVRMTLGSVCLDLTRRLFRGSLVIVLMPDPTLLQQLEARARQVAPDTDTEAAERLIRESR